MGTHSRTLLASIMLLALTGAAAAQFTDDFSDPGDILHERWQGDRDRIAIVPFGDGRALRSAGLPVADTIALAAASYMAFGTWEAEIHYRGGRLTNFNLVRIYLTASSPDIKDNPSGYYLQIGSNNRDVQLFRSDPTLAAGRTLLGRSAANVLPDDEAMVRVRVRRSFDMEWTVIMDDRELFSVVEGGRFVLTSRHAGIWIKHSAARPNDYIVDRIALLPAPAPEPAVTDLAFHFPDVLVLDFDGPLWPPSVTPATFRVDEGRATVSDVELATLGPPAADQLRLRLAEELRAGTYSLEMDGLLAMDGTPVPATGLAFHVPKDTALAAVEVIDGVRIRLGFERAVDTLSLAGSFSLNSFPGTVAEVRVISPTDVTLVLDRVMDPGTTYLLEVSGVRDEVGRPLDDSAVQLLFEPDQAPVPQVLFVARETEHVARVQFDRDLDPGSACATGGPAVLDSRGSTLPVDRAVCPPVPFTHVLVHAAFADGESYQITFDGLRSAMGSPSAPVSVVLYTGAAERAPRPREIVVNEIFYAPDDPLLEFVELFNRTDAAFDLADLAISDDREDPVRITEHPTILPPGGYAVVVRNAQVFSAAFPGTPHVQLPRWHVLNRTGDSAILYHGDEVIDLVPYRPSWGGDGVSLERIDPNRPSDRRDNFGSSTAAAGATPGARNSIFDPDITPPDVLFADQVAETMLEIRFDEPVVITSSVQVTLGASDALLQPTDDEHVLMVLLSREPTAGTLTLAGVEDLAGSRLPETLVPIAFLPSAGEVVITEIMFDPRVDRHDPRPDQPHYVELLNRGARLLSLRLGYWTDEPGRDGDADTLALGNALAAIAPGGYAVVVPSGGPPLAGAFPDFAGSEATLIALPRQTLRLPNAGDVIRLHARDGTVLDVVPYDPLWHHPSLAATKGISLERIDPGAASHDPTNWSSSTASGGGTPGRPNSLSLAPGEPPPEPGLDISPSPFSPDGDGIDDVTAIRFTLSGPSSLVRAMIFDQRGRLVRKLTPAALAGRTGTLIWDGLDDQGRALRIGIYIVFLEATDAQNGTVERHRGVVVLARPLR
jgi:hypothetical protein